VYQISRQSDNAFVFYNNFHTFTKRRRKEKKKRKKKEKKKKKETKPIFEGSYLGNAQYDLVEI